MSRKIHITKKQQRAAKALQNARWRLKYPIKAIYIARKSRAKERGKPFTISYERFETWCIQSGYHLLRGRSKDDASIDCIIEHLGYADGNLQILTVSQNCIKEHARRKGIDWTPMDIENF